MHYRTAILIIMTFVLAVVAVMSDFHPGAVAFSVIAFGLMIIVHLIYVMNKKYYDEVHVFPAVENTKEFFATSGYKTDDEYYEDPFVFLADYTRKMFCMKFSVNAEILTFPFDAVTEYNLSEDTTIIKSSLRPDEPLRESAPQSVNILRLGLKLSGDKFELRTFTFVNSSTDTTGKKYENALSRALDLCAFLDKIMKDSRADIKTQPDDTDKNENSDKEECAKNLFPQYLDCFYKKYSYTDKVCLIGTTAADASGLCGKNLIFEQEPTNEHDNRAVSVSCNGKKIGYVFRGKIQDMLNDWIERDEPFLGYISEILKTENTVTYKVAFYRSLDEFDSKVYPLTRLGADCGYCKRRDNLEEMNEGDGVTAEYESEDEAYVVYDKHGNQIGELPARFAADARGCDDTLPGVVEEISYTDDKVSGKVRIYFKS